MHRGDEFGVIGGDADIVGGPGPVRRAQQVEIRERQIERCQRRAERQPEEADQPGRQKQIARRAFAPGYSSRQIGWLRAPKGGAIGGITGGIDRRVQHCAHPRASTALLSATNCLAPSAGVRRPKPTCSLTRRSSSSISPAPRGGGGGKGPTLSP